MTSAIPISAAEYTVGVKVGEWIKYGEFHATYTGPEPSTFAAFAALEDVDWMKVEVKSVSGTTVTAEMTGKFKNGTSIPSSTGTIDIATGQGTGGFFMMLIGANLKEGDTIPQQYGAAKINGTVTRTYCGASRSVNFIDFTVSVPQQSSTLKAYWDKATGVLVEFYMSMSSTAPAQSMEISWKAIETNMWSPDLLGLLWSNLYIIGIVVLVIFVVVVGVFFVRRRKPAPTVAPTPTAQG